jgi:hypothetical protein
MKTMNGLPIVVNESGSFLSGDVMVLSEHPYIAFTDRNGPPNTVDYDATSTGFCIILNSFDRGSAMTSTAQGTLNGSNIRFIVHAHRIAEAAGRAIYRVDVLVYQA